QMLGLIYCNASLVSMFLSILLNGALALIVFVRRDKVSSYRRFFYFFCLLDILFSVAQWIVAPLFWSEHGVIVVIAVSADSTNVYLMEIGLLIWLAAFMLVAILVTASFVYRCA
ncbi:hypothetical protein PFISCL1PPCAC_2750, partial [Pristionchus fissidentatus]